MLSWRNRWTCSSTSFFTSSILTPDVGSALRSAISMSARSASCIMSASMCVRSTSDEVMARVNAPDRCIAAHSPAPAVVVASKNTAAPAAMTF